MLKTVQGKIKLGDREVNYIIEKKFRTKRISLRVSDGKVLVIAPRLVSDGFIERVIQNKSTWINKRINFFENEAKALPNINYEDHKVKAVKFVQERIAFYNKFYGFSFNRVSVKNHKGRWGSCSGKGNLNFNYRILVLPLDVADYIVVHELCHLEEMNHSVNFWKLVAKTLPEYKKLRYELKKIIY